MVKLKLDSVYYDRERPILSNFSLDIPDGGIVALVGPSGVGKSTVLKIIAGLHTGYTGAVETGSGTRMAIVPQNNGLLPWKTVYENIVLLKRLAGVVDKSRADELIERLGLTPFCGKYPLRLSGGQYQRAVLGQAFFYEPDIILMDEPFSALDDRTKKEAQDIFLRLRAERQMTAVMVTHNLSEAEYIGAEIVDLTGLKGGD